jgi:hypothetical protein
LTRNCTTYPNDRLFVLCSLLGPTALSVPYSAQDPMRSSRHGAPASPGRAQSLARLESYSGWLSDWPVRLSIGPVWVWAGEHPPVGPNPGIRTGILGYLADSCRRRSYECQQTRAFCYAPHSEPGRSPTTENRGRRFESACRHPRIEADRSRRARSVYSAGPPKTSDHQAMTYSRRALSRAVIERWMAPLAASVEAKECRGVE